MRKLSILLAVCALAGSLPGQEQDFSKVQMKVTKVAGKVYMLEGAGGNIGASVGDDGIVIVDDQYAPLAEKIQAALKGITDKPVRFIINTHYHGDHTGGNSYFQKQAPIIAHDNVRKRLEHDGGAGNGGSIHMETKAAPHDALDTVSFGWVLARLHKGTRLMFERTRVNEEVWLPQHLTFKLDARVALLKGYNQRDEQAYRDYQKFRATAKIVGIGDVKEK